MSEVGKWIGRSDDKIPNLHAETIVEWMNSDGYRNETKAGTLVWNDEVSPVIAYRIVKEYKEPREYFVVFGGFGYLISYHDTEEDAKLVASHYDGRTYAKFREVIDETA